MTLATSQFKFGIPVNHGKYYPTDDKKYSQRGRGQGHMTALLNFVTVTITLERVKIDTSNLVCRLVLAKCYPADDKILPQNGVVFWLNFYGERDRHFNFWDRSLSVEWVMLDTSNLTIAKYYAVQRMMKSRE